MEADVKAYLQCRNNSCSYLTSFIVLQKFICDDISAFSNYEASENELKHAVTTAALYAMHKPCIK